MGGMWSGLGVADGDTLGRVHGYTVYSYDIIAHTHMHGDKRCTAAACHILLWVISHASTIGSCRSENTPNCLRLQTLISLRHWRLAVFVVFF